MRRGGFVQNKCPKCGGNVYLDVDEQDWYEQCLQCSYTRFLDKIADAKVTVNSKRTPLTTAGISSN